MTEDEAKTKWCPFASNRVVSWRKSPVELVNAVQAEADGSPPTTACIASACMAWCISHTVRGPVVERMKAEPGSRRPAGSDWGYEAIDPKRPSAGGEWVRWAPGVGHGGCGLAGAPR